MTVNHNYIKKSFKDFGRWQQCEKCGATIHSGYYWLGGFKSRIEPPCNSDFADWLKNASQLNDGDLI